MFSYKHMDPLQYTQVSIYYTYCNSMTVVCKLLQKPPVPTNDHQSLTITGGETTAVGIRGGRRSHCFSSHKDVLSPKLWVLSSIKSWSILKQTKPQLTVLHSTSVVEWNVMVLSCNLIGCCQIGSDQWWKEKSVLMYCYITTILLNCK